MTKTNQNDTETLTATEFEQHLKELIEQTPESKYELWQTIQYKSHSGKTVSGRICGLYFTRVAIAFEEDSYPGWYYYIEGDRSHRIIHEEDIVEEVKP